ncbi:MAG TPA: hypothetical protein VM076_25930 [Gemmatimonadaceae bacterium]|nr:hypothetical protein [Gemmatimonadaceae bacterium]
MVALYKIVLNVQSHAVAADPLRSITIVHTRPGASLGFAVVIPAFDTRWFSHSGSTRPIAMLIGLAALAILALLVASAAHRRNQRPRSSDSQDELFTSTPLPMRKENVARRARSEPDHYAFSSLKLPRWVQAGSLVVALAFTWVVANRIRPGGPTRATRDTVRIGGIRVGGGSGATDAVTDSPEDLDLSPDSAPTFSFRARDWIASNGGCAGRLEVTKGEPRGWNLTARVHDDQGQLLDSARTRVASLQLGDVVEFRFARAACERIGAWDVRGARRDP